MDSASIITLVLSFFFSIGTAYFVSQREIAKLYEERKIHLQEEVIKYSLPILKSAADLQDRLWHLTQVEARKKEDEISILHQKDENLIGHPNWPMTRKHYLSSTIYFFAQYFAWVEILELEMKLIDLGKSNETRNFYNALKQVEITLSDTRLHNNLNPLGQPVWIDQSHLKNTCEITSDRPLFRLQQAAIGQALIEKEQTGMTCQNYRDFMIQFDSKLEGQEEFQCLEELILRAVNQDPKDFALARCCILANQLVDLMNLLDPEMKFVFTSKRDYVSIPGF